MNDHQLVGFYRIQEKPGFSDRDVLILITTGHVAHMDISRQVDANANITW